MYSLYGYRDGILQATSALPLEAKALEERSTVPTQNRCSRSGCLSVPKYVPLNKRKKREAACFS